MSTTKTPRERLQEALDVWTMSPVTHANAARLAEAARAVLREPEPRAMTKAERKLCDWARRGVRYNHPLLTELANAVWDEEHPPPEPKRTLEDVEREIRGHDISTALGLDCVQPLMNERQKLIDEEKES